MVKLWFESFYLLGVTFVVFLISLLVSAWFRWDNDDLSSQLIELEDLKKKKFKTVDEQMIYLRNKNDTGNDFLLVIIPIFFYVLIFQFLVLPNINVMARGILAALVVGSTSSALVSYFVLSRKYFFKNYWNFFLNYFFIGFFICYLKFFDTWNPLIMFLCIISLMILISFIWKKIKWRNK